MTGAAVGRTTRRAHRRLGVGLGLAVALLLSGCPSPPPVAEPTSTERSSPRDVVPSAPVTAAPVTGGTPVGPAVTVDLVGEVPAGTALQVSGTRDGAALVLLGRPSPEPATLVQVSADGRRTRSVPVPGIASAWDLHGLPDGTALVTGVLAGGTALGFVAVDPATGTASTVTTLPLAEATISVTGGSTLSHDGRTVWLFSSALVDGRFEYLVTGHDLAARELIAARDLFADLRGIHVPHQEVDLVGIDSTAGGELLLAVNTFPSGSSGLWTPTFLVYDAALEPLVPPTDLAPASVGTGTALAVAADGTAYVLVRGPVSDTLVALPGPARRPEPRLEMAGSGAPGDLVIDARGRALLPGGSGARSIDLVTGSTTEIDVGCSGPVTVRDMTTSTGGRTWMIGGCFVEGRLPTVLWSVD